MLGRKRAAMFPEVEIDIILEDAVYFCGDGTDHETIVASFLDLHEQARRGITILLLTSEFPDF